LKTLLDYKLRYGLIFGIVSAVLAVLLRASLFYLGYYLAVKYESPLGEFLMLKIDFIVFTTVIILISVFLGIKYGSKKYTKSQENPK